jgi:hypothetical protein
LLTLIATIACSSNRKILSVNTRKLLHGTLDFLLHAAQTAFSITLGRLESSAVIAA